MTIRMHHPPKLADRKRVPSKLTASSFLPQIEVVGSVPPGCFGYLVDDNHSAPVLRMGEFAIVDATIREPENGALFLIEWSTGDRDIVETYPRPIERKDGTEAMHWWTARYNRPRCREDLDEAILNGVELSTVDGPYARMECLAEKLIGKVVGVLARDRHTRVELQRLRDVRSCPPHILASGYGRRQRGYVPPAGSSEWGANS